MRASVGGSPLSGPDWVPIMVHCATTYGSSTAVTCSSNRKSGKALNRPDAYGSTSEGALTVGRQTRLRWQRPALTARYAHRRELLASQPPSPTDIGLHQGRLADTAEARTHRTLTRSGRSSNASNAANSAARPMNSRRLAASSVSASSDLFLGLCCSISLRLVRTPAPNLVLRF
jgi:hypothetical protein